MSLPRILLSADAAAVFGWVLAEPFVPDAVGVAVALLLGGLHLPAVRRGPRLARLDAGFRRRPGAVNAALLVVSPLVFLGGLELGARGLVAAGWVEVYSPMRTMLPGGVEDWRLAHLTADRHREPDPVLLWRPVAAPPYNRHRLKGAEVAAEKPAGTVRVLCYGDSNTDGPDRWGWPQRLERALNQARDGRRYQVLNAGVVGYSSFQGLARFREQVARWRPDVVLVSFGWNDLAPALGAPDRSFRPPPRWLVGAQRILVRYTFYRVLQRYRPRAGRSPAAVGPRVALADYLENMAGFADLAAAHGARAVFLTRPHRDSAASLAASGGDWRAAVPRYNAALRRFAEESGHTLVDVQGAFEGGGDALFVDECHFTPKGHERMARLLSGRLGRRPEPVAGEALASESHGPRP